MRTCVQVPSTDFRGVVLDGDSQEESHLTWTVQSCSLGYFLPDIAHSSCSSLLWSVFLSSGKIFHLAEQKVEISSTLEACMFFHEAFLSLFPMHLAIL